MIITFEFPSVCDMALSTSAGAQQRHGFQRQAVTDRTKILTNASLLMNVLFNLSMYALNTLCDSEWNNGTLQLYIQLDFPNLNPFISNSLLF